MKLQNKQNFFKRTPIIPSISTQTPQKFVLKRKILQSNSFLKTISYNQNLQKNQKNDSNFVINLQLIKNNQNKSPINRRHSENSCIINTSISSYQKYKKQQKQQKTIKEYHNLKLKQWKRKTAQQKNIKYRKYSLVQKISQDPSNNQYLTSKNDNLKINRQTFQNYFETHGIKYNKKNEIYRQKNNATFNQNKIDLQKIKMKLQMNLLNYNNQTQGLASPLITTIQPQFKQSNSKQKQKNLNKIHIKANKTSKSWRKPIYIEDFNFRPWSGAKNITALELDISHIIDI